MYNDIDVMATFKRYLNNCSSRDRYKYITYDSVYGIALHSHKMHYDLLKGMYTYDKVQLCKLNCAVDKHTRYDMSNNNPIDDMTNDWSINFDAYNCLDVFKDEFKDKEYQLLIDSRSKDVYYVSDELGALFTTSIRGDWTQGFEFLFGYSRKILTYDPIFDECHYQYKIDDIMNNLMLWCLNK